MDIFLSSVNSAGKGVVFEYDGETGYFYLCEVSDGDVTNIIEHLHVFSGVPDFAENDLSILWNDKESKVALLIKNIVWAIFDCENNTKYGGNYRSGVNPALSF